MILRLVLRGLKQGKARFACAALGVAAALGAVVFTYSLKTSNDAQAPALARIAVAPWQSWKVDGRFLRPRRGMPPPAPAEEIPETPVVHPPAADLVLPLVGMTIDYRPGGHVLQGPPMRGTLAPAPAECPYANATLSGRWVDVASPALEIVAAKSALQRFGRGTPPDLGSVIKFVGRTGTMSATLVGYLDGVKIQPGWPTVFANAAAFDALAAEEHGSIALWRDKVVGTGVKTIDDISASFETDAGKNFGRAKALLLWAAALTALCLLVNSLFLSIEANRRQIAVLRTIGLTRGGVVRYVLAESLLATLAGIAVGVAVSIAALYVYVAADKEMFPAGPALSVPAIGGAVLAALAVSVLATLLLLKPALSVRALEAASDAPQTLKRRAGMVVAFAFGFGAFVAVEVWGASLMKPFVPSPEWPDAIVSLLPAGVPAAGIEKVRGLPGIARIAELRPFQANYHPEEPMAGPRGPEEGPRGMRPQFKNALLLGSDWLPRFRFDEGSYEEAAAALQSTNACVITAMMTLGRGLHKGDTLALSVRGKVAELTVVGVVDLNWHMVTSRGLVRGLNGAPSATDGPIFVSFDTLESIRNRGPRRGRDEGPLSSSLTHFWLDYTPEFLAEQGGNVFQAGRIVEDRIRIALGDPTTATVRLHARDEISDGTLAHGSNIIGSMARIPFLFIAVLSFGFVAMLVASADASKKEFAVLRAVGATKAQLATRLFLEALRTAVFGIALGLAGGAVAGYLTSAATRKAMTMWTLPATFVVPWGVLALGAAIALGFVVLVAIPASMLLIRRGIKAGLAR